MTSESSSEKLWRQFEASVAHFLTAAGPLAKVTHDYKQTDPDTGSLRQRDVWIEMVFCGLFPIHVLVSCKRWSKKLNAKDIEHFFGELSGANAHLGVIYSHLGFAKTAVRKARSLGRGRLHCCQLYADQSPEIPDVLIVKECYCLTPVARFALTEPPNPQRQLTTWGDVFNLEPTLTEKLKATLQQMSHGAVKEMKEKPNFPKWYSCDVEIGDSQSNYSSVKLRLTLGWKIYEGAITANLLNGTYCLTEDKFVGSQTTPWIDTQGPNPGPAWKLLDSQPAFPKSGTVAVLYGGIRDAELQSLASKPVSILSNQTVSTVDDGQPLPGPQSRPRLS